MVKLLDILNETGLTKTLMHRKGVNGERTMAGVFSKRRGVIPPVIIRYTGKDDSFIGILPTTKAKQLYKTRPSEVYDSHDVEMTQVLRAYSSLRDDVPYENYPEYFQIKKVNKIQLFDLLINKIGLHKGYFGDAFGEVSVEDRIKEKYGATSIVYADNTKETTKQLIRKYLDKVRESLKPFGLDGLLKGIFIFEVIRDRSADATYNYTNSETRVNLKTLRDTTALKNIIHEMGHKWEHQRNINNLVDEKYTQLISSGEGYRAVTDNLNINTDDVFELDYKKYKGTKFHYLSMDREKEKMKLGVSNENEKYSIDIPFRMINLHPGILTRNGNPFTIPSESKWFISEYSATNPREFFAENFVNYILGECEPEVCEWFASLPH